MLQLIVMFILGAVFAGCLMFIAIIHLLFAEDDAQDAHLEEMSKWYEEEYGNDDVR